MLVTALTALICSGIRTGPHRPGYHVGLGPVRVGVCLDRTRAGADERGYFHPVMAGLWTARDGRMVLGFDAWNGSVYLMAGNRTTLAW